MKPITGVTCNTHWVDQSPMPGITRSVVNTPYITSVVKAGGVPLLLPPVADPEIVRAQVRGIDGLILTGGPDVDPLLFGEEPLAKLGTVNHPRDAYELTAIKAAEEFAKPVLGICRGAQIINVAYGGTLYQDLSYIDGCHLSHFQTVTQSDILWHTVSAEPASALARITGHRQFPVNSYHHQAVKTVAPGFSVTALSADGVVEAIEGPANQFILGVQWHPELLAESNQPALALFQALVEQARPKEG